MSVTSSITIKADEISSIQADRPSALEIEAWITQGQAEDLLTELDSAFGLRTLLDKVAPKVLSKINEEVAADAQGDDQ